MSRSQTPGTPSRVEARRKKTARTRIVLSVTAAAAVVAVGVAVADSSHDDARTDRQAGGAAGTASGTGSATPTAAPTDAAPTGTPDASASAPASASASPSGTPDAGATESTAPAEPTTPASSAPAKSAEAPPAQPSRKPAPTKSSGSGGSGGSGGAGTVNTDAESAVLALVNKERAAAGCDPLTANAKLNAAARAYSDTMARSGVMSHTGPDGSTMTSRVEAAGYQWSRLGENIARGQADADAVMKAWMNSSGHKANILNCAFREIGIGVHKGDGGPWWTQNFGTGK
ncbi:CAP domain-containing protein [Streptomyces sp. NPDC058646]|uniref:CAP domain-containing protein n=1 Tax=Streptomyces sp. NPDC058646 TaxID=3346574 RepID=UPI00364E6815